MSRTGTGGGAESAPDAEPGLARVFVLILLTQAAAIAALYWFGRHFS